MVAEDYIDGSHQVQSLSPMNNLKGKVTPERRYPMNIGIAGYVVKTGALVNAKSAKDHPAFDPDVDGYQGIDVK